ncbi:putative uncharacterized protein [Parachlamydia acanthamoebae UV-7]|uniref:Uncharacterized protein n=2 Tax=Parachlamydia acanthamoebae TaxID=83552 RepID=F8KVK7_PARAV|nr:efflux RND transporter periplasmic adaptor subunit [Parachlamydia acanthamoebae]KIA76346.1 hypothetical protein DB43_AK00060 [Parachlamydia acanthamoebae]CCB85143.1 putative uncharacterized protein [Parachlamydia acanthamoebae UV-7]
MSRKQLYFLFLCSAFLGVTLGVWAWHHFQIKKTVKITKRQTTDLPVSVTIAELHPFQDFIDVIGTVYANESVQLSAKVTETVTKINFTEGQYVEKGEVIVELNSEEEKAIFEEAEKQYTRIQNLAQSAAVTLTKRDQQLMNMQIAQAKLNNRKIIAPFSGILGLRKVSEGTLVTPGTVITSLDDISKIKFEFSISEKRVGLVSVGQPIQASSIAYPNEAFIGTIYAMDTRVNSLTRALAAKAIIPNEKFLLKPGMLLHARIFLPAENILILPEEAILSKKGDKVVYVIDADELVEKRPVQLGRRLAGSVEITEGLQPGERVILESRVVLESGQKVAIIETKTIESSHHEFQQFKS